MTSATPRPTAADAYERLAQLAEALRQHHEAVGRCAPLMRALEVALRRDASAAEGADLRDKLARLEAPPFPFTEVVEAYKVEHEVVLERLAELKAELEEVRAVEEAVVAACRGEG